MAEKEELTRLLYVRSSISSAGKEPKPRGSSHRRFRLERGRDRRGGRERGRGEREGGGRGKERGEGCRKGGREGVKTKAINEQEGGASVTLTQG